MVPGLRLGFAALALAAIGTQLAIHVALGFSVVNFFSYFTNLSNLLAAGVLVVWALRPPGSPAPGEIWRAFSVLNMVVVGLVFAVLLRDVDLGALRPWVNTVLHGVMPIVVLADWLLQPPTPRLGIGRLPRLLVFPIAYLAWTLARGSATGWYPYPFLDPARVGGTAVAGYSLAIAVTFLAAGAAVLAIGARRGGPASP